MRRLNRTMKIPGSDEKDYANQRDELPALKVGDEVKAFLLLDVSSKAECEGAQEEIGLKTKAEDDK